MKHKERGGMGRKLVVNGEGGLPLDDLKGFLDDPVFADFRRAWEGACHGQAVPRRQDISLRGFAKFVSNMQILTREGTGDYRYRQIGETVRGGLKVVGKGDDGFSLIDAAVQPASARFIDAMFLTPCGGLMDYSIDYPGPSVGRVCTIHLPVLADEGDDCLLIAFNKLIARKHTLLPNGALSLGKQLCRGVLFDVGGGLPEGDAAGCDFEMGDTGYLR